MTKAESEHYDKVARLGCAACWRIHGPHEPGPVEIHHFRGGGWGKTSWLCAVGLCYEHHRGNTGVHGLGTKGFAKHHGFDQTEMLNDTRQRLEKMS